MPLNHWVSGEEVDAADFQMENENFLTLIGNIAAIFFGVTSFQAGIEPLELTIDSNGNGSIGGEPNQLCYLNGRQCSGIDSYAFTVSGNGGSVTRNDVIYGTWNEKDSGSFTRSQRNPDGSITPNATFYQTAHDIAFSYVQGNSDGSLGPQPSGTVQIATITVPPGGAASYEITLPTLNSVIAGVIVALGYLQTLNGLGGNVSLTSTDGSVVITESGEAINLHVPQAAEGVTSVNQQTGAVIVESGEGISVGTSGDTIQVTNEGVLSLQGETGLVTLTSPDGSITIGTSGNEITLESAETGGVESIVANGTTYTGAVDLLAGDGAVTFSHLEGSSGSDGLEISVAYPLGAVIKRVARIMGTDTLSVSLPTLPITGSSWMILGRAAATVTNYNFKLNLTGCSDAESNIGNGSATAMSVEYAEISGNANGGQTPELTITWQNASGGSFQNGQLLVIEAIRVS
jgi:hypothetical protein